jgi:hypothetical protein
VDQVQEKIQELNAMIGGGLPFELGLYDPKKLKLLETNARYMANDKFARLVENVKRDKGLASVPLVYAAENPKEPTVLSGNHRVLAAIAAGLPWVLCLVIRDVKTLDEQVAIQLSHNSISGADDLLTLKKLYEGIQAISMKAYSGLDEDTIQQLAAIKFEPISEPRLVFKTVSLLFLPSEAEEIKAMVGQVDKLLAEDENYLFQVRDYGEFFALVVAAKEGLNIKNSATALLELMRAGLRHLTVEQDTRSAGLAEAETVAETGVEMAESA